MDVACQSAGCSGRRLEADEDKERLEAALRKIASVKPFKDA
jgi:hypothetical protein